MNIPRIGKIYKKDKKLVLIIEGQYEGSYGRISNYWVGREVNKGGGLGEEIGGYGGEFKPIRKKYEVITIVKFKK